MSKICSVTTHLHRNVERFSDSFFFRRMKPDANPITACLVDGIYLERSNILDISTCVDL